MSNDSAVVVCDGGCAPTAIRGVAAPNALPEGWCEIPAKLTPWLSRRGWTINGLKGRARLYLCPSCTGAFDEDEEQAPRMPIDAERLIRQLAEHNEAMEPGPWMPATWYGSEEGGHAAIGPHHEAQPLSENAAEYKYRQYEDGAPGGPVEARALRDAAGIAWFGTNRGKLLAIIKTLKAERDEMSASVDEVADICMASADDAAHAIAVQRDGAIAEAARLRTLLVEVRSRLNFSGADDLRARLEAEVGS